LFKLENWILPSWHHQVRSCPGNLDYILLCIASKSYWLFKIPIQTLKVGSLGTHNLLGLARVKRLESLLHRLLKCTEIHWFTTNWGILWQRKYHRTKRMYDEAKRFQESITMAYHTFHGVETRIVRIFNTYGPRMRLNDGRVIPAL
jgi:dTDP-glucose 4,6-dehydratase